MYNLRTNHALHFGTVRKLLAGAGVIAALAAATAAYADDPISMAPPVDAPYSTTADTSSGSPSVFNWREIPLNQQVPLNRAVFDRGGYQLFDQAGETIVVPFTDDNLYVMKFAVSDTGQMYFINNGDTPVLYVPVNGYLENASAAGARWYPFTQQFRPATPVFLGCAPSWDVFVGLGWYPNMCVYGGYWCAQPFYVHPYFAPAPAFFIAIGDRRFFGFGTFNNYCFAHPAPYHVTVINRNIYRWDGPRGPWAHPFLGSGHPYWGGARPFVADNRVFNGAGHPYTIEHRYDGDQPRHEDQGFHGFGQPNGIDHSSDWHNRGDDNAPQGAHVFHGSGQPGAPDRSADWQHNSGGDNQPQNGHVFRGFDPGQDTSWRHQPADNSSHGPSNDSYRNAPPAHQFQGADPSSDHGGNNTQGGFHGGQSSGYDRHGGYQSPAPSSYSGHTFQSPSQSAPPAPSHGTGGSGWYSHGSNGQSNGNSGGQTFHGGNMRQS